jgi:lipopolysaccharide/colanic/teichoic acid biosynthesis glycosyltransferase
MSRSTGAKDFVQRFIDIGIATAVLILFSPALLLVALLVRIGLGRPVLFCQLRAGRYGQPFTLVKFRTMRNVDPERGLISDADRMTRLGRLLRSTSLDELPTMWNVLSGDMSLVGPRPLLLRYLDRYTPEQARRHLVRPGVTGLAQVQGRNALSWEDKFALDVWYVDHRSVGLNLRILGKTCIAVFRYEGTSTAGGATMPEFYAPTRLNEKTGPKNDSVRH